MDYPALDIDALPLLDTMVGLFGSLVVDSLTAVSVTQDLAVIIATIVSD